MAFDGCLTVTCFVVSMLFACLDCRSFKPPQIEDTKYWETLGQKELERALNEDVLYNKGVARNVIVAIGDGMGISTVTASRIYDGQSRGESGEENSLLFERFPHSALLKTYTLDWQIPDSASTAFCILSGIKAKALTCGLDMSVKFNVCAPQEGHKIDTILDWSLAAGKSVGIVTTDSLTGGTPSAAYAHTPSRFWTNDHMTKAPCRDIARQLIEKNPQIHVILGGGKYHFIPRDLIPANSSDEYGRRDSRNLIQEWIQQKKDVGAKHRFVENVSDLNAVDTTKVDYLLGLFSPDRMPPIHKRGKSMPSLEEMTRKAIEILSKNEKGFFLLLEGANIDQSHHDNYAQMALREVMEFNRAIGVVDTTTNQSETTIAVTADHSHVFTIGGFPPRGNPITGFTNDPFFPILDKKLATTLGYINGPGWTTHQRPHINSTHLENLDFRYTGGRASFVETHSGEDVAVYARGPWAHLFHGVHEQSYIAHVLAYASCVGDRRQTCRVSSVSQVVGNAPRHLVVVSVTVVYGVIRIAL